MYDTTIKLIKCAYKHILACRYFDLENASNFLPNLCGTCPIPSQLFITHQLQALLAPVFFTHIAVTCDTHFSHTAMISSPSPKTMFYLS